MSKTSKTTGGCLCGAVRFTLNAAPTEYAACHCGMCRKFSGGIELGVQVPPGGVVWDNEDAIKTYASSDWAERGFCGTCGSSLFWRLTAEGPMQGMLSLSGGALDTLEGIRLTSEIYIDHKPAGHDFAGDHMRMTEAELLASMGITPEA